MKLSFALLPLATLFLGVVSSPTAIVEKSVAVDERATSDPLAILQSFTAESKQYTDTISSASAPLSLFSSPADLSSASDIIVEAIQALETLVKSTLAELTGNGVAVRSIVLRSGNPLDSSAASEISAFLAELTGLSWNLQDLFGFAGPIGDSLGPLVGAVTQLWAVVLSL